jgi:hypothetical protein
VGLKENIIYCRKNCISMINILAQLCIVVIEINENRGRYLCLRRRK